MPATMHFGLWSYMPRFGNEAISAEIKVFETRWEGGIYHTVVLTADTTNKRSIEQNILEIKRRLEAQQIAHVDAVIYLHSPADVTLKRLVVKNDLPAWVEESVIYFAQRGATL